MTRHIDIEEIRSLYESGMQQDEIAKKLGVGKIP